MTEKAPGRVGRFIRSEGFQTALEALRTDGVSLLVERRPIPQNMLEGIGVFEDPRAVQVMGYVCRELSISDWLIFVKTNLKKDASQFVPQEEINSRLSVLTEKGFVQRHEPDPGGLPTFTPTQKGVRVYNAIRTI